MLDPLNANSTKWSNTLKFLTNCLSVFDHFVKLAFKGLISVLKFRDDPYYWSLSYDEQINPRAKEIPSKFWKYSKIFFQQCFLVPRVCVTYVAACYGKIERVLSALNNLSNDLEGDSLCFIYLIYWYAWT